MDHSAAHYRARTPCRCERCTEAHRRRYAAERAARRAECVVINERAYSVNPRTQHGTVNGYSYYGCRCAPCTRANTQSHKRHRHSKGTDS